jgi:hypothetical protein
VQAAQRVEAAGMQAARLVAMLRVLPTRYTNKNSRVFAQTQDALEAGRSGLRPWLGGSNPSTHTT